MKQRRVCRDNNSVRDTTTLSVVYILDRMLHLALIHEQWHIFQQLLELIILNPTWSPYLDIQNDLGQVRCAPSGLSHLISSLYLIGVCLVGSQSALHLAVILGSAKCVGSLLAAGVNVELQERAGNTALHLAVCEQHTECVRALTASSRILPQHINIYNYKGTPTTKHTQPSQRLQL